MGETMGAPSVIVPLIAAFQIIPSSTEDKTVIAFFVWAGRGDSPLFSEASPSARSLVLLRQSHQNECLPIPSFKALD